MSVTQCLWRVWLGDRLTPVSSLRAAIVCLGLAMGLALHGGPASAQENEWLKREDGGKARAPAQAKRAAEGAARKADGAKKTSPDSTKGVEGAKAPGNASVAAGAANGAATGAAAATATAKGVGRVDACDPFLASEEQLRQVLQQHERSKIGFRYKFRRGVLPGRNAGDLAITARPAAALIADIRSNLARLDGEGLRTAALIYGEGGCAFLLTAEGIEVAVALPKPGAAFAGTVAAGVRSGLGLERRIAARAPRLRTAPGAKADASEAAGADASVADGTGATAPTRERAVATLQSAADALLPKAITDRLARKDIARLLVLPTSDLGTVPLAALPVADRQLIDVTMPVVLADIEGLMPWERPQFRPTTGAKLLVGDPDLSGDRTWVFQPLPGAKLEVEQVAHLVGGAPLLAQAATREAVMRTLRAEQSRLSLIYFATHGIADGVNPMDASFLALKDGLFPARDIRSLKLERHPLVVMSACQSGLGKVFEGGVFGLARAWHYAGASQVVMSLWNVDDEATRFLMTHLFELMARAPVPEVAMRLAMQRTRERFPDPALWASFTFYGLPTRGHFVD